MIRPNLTRSQKALHLLVAATFLVANLLCPCVSAVQIHEDASATSDCHHEASKAEASGTAGQAASHPHCPDCDSAEIMGCAQDVLIVPGAKSLKAQTDSAPDQPAPNWFAVLDLMPVFPLAGSPVGPPAPRFTRPADSPVERHDQQLE